MKVKKPPTAFQSRIVKVKKAVEPAIFTIEKASVSERMERFLRMKASDLDKAKRREYACEKPVLKTPKDTLRCSACSVLYERVKHEQHKKECKKKSGLKYGCVACKFTHTDIQELQKHIISCRKEKK